LVLAAWPGLASAQEAAAAPTAEETARASCEWNPQWSRFTIGESIATGSMGLGLLLATLALEPPDGATWQGAILLDGPTRGSLRASSASARDTMADVSDVLLYALMAMPVIDAGVAWGVHGSPEVALEMMAMTAQSFALTSLVTQLTKRLVGRERPYGELCDPEDPAEQCAGGSRYESFLSGHTSLAFTSAGLVCAHHESLPLFGGGPADAAACVLAVGAATTVGAMRIGADRHYLSDVMMGAALGLLSGYALPNWLHYDIGDDDPRTGAPEGGRITPMATLGGAGFGYQHVWY
jgi:membrane-associated phospholipid phosphatase